MISRQPAASRSSSRYATPTRQHDLIGLSFSYWSCFHSAMDPGTDRSGHPEGAVRGRALKKTHIVRFLVALAICAIGGFYLGRHGHGFLFSEDRSFEICKYLVEEALSGVAEVRGRRISDGEVELSFQVNDLNGTEPARSPNTARCEFFKKVADRDPAVRRVTINGRTLRPDAVEATMQYWVSYRR
jgi:hypothetical protein